MVSSIRYDAGRERRSNPRYWIDEAGLYVKWWLGASAVGVQEQAKDNGPRKVVDRRIAQYWPQFEEAFEKIDFGEESWRFATAFVCEGGPRNFRSWDGAANWLEDQRLRYEEILCA